MDTNNFVVTGSVNANKEAKHYTNSHSSSDDPIKRKKLKISFYDRRESSSSVTSPPKFTASPITSYADNAIITNPTNIEDASHTYVSQQEIKEVKGDILADFNSEVCNVCLDVEGFSDLLMCDGGCLRSFHLECIDLPSIPMDDSWICNQCRSKEHLCFKCGVSGSDANFQDATDNGVVKCNVQECGLYFHIRCVERMQLATTHKDYFICPRHTCCICIRDCYDRPSLSVCATCATACHSKCMKRFRKRGKVRIYTSFTMQCPSCLSKCVREDINVISQTAIMPATAQSEALTKPHPLPPGNSNIHSPSTIRIPKSTRLVLTCPTTSQHTVEFIGESAEEGNFMVPNTEEESVWNEDRFDNFILKLRGIAVVDVPVSIAM